MLIALLTILFRLSDISSLQLCLDLHFGFSSTLRNQHLLNSGTVGLFMRDPLS